MNLTNRTPKLSITHYILVAAFIISIIATGFVVFKVFSLIFEPPPESGYVALSSVTGGATAISPPRLVEDFTLTSHTGDPFHLSDLRGKTVLIFFGYTHCPDVCPLTLTEFQQVKAILNSETYDVAFVFVSVDGERDTPEWLARYLDVRGVADTVIGLTGPEDDLRRIGVDYGLYFEKRTDTDSRANYLVDHTASSFLLDAEGRLTTIFKFGTEAETIANTIRNLDSEESTTS